MRHEELEPRDARERLLTTKGGLYLDVRSVPEFTQGHPTGAWNLPMFHLTPQGMQPNPEFGAVADLAWTRELLLVVGCQSGGRSARACEVLVGLGFTRLVNVAGGFGGVHHPATGELLVAGWQALGLPVSTTPEPGRSWEELRALLA